jgi:hypothetical protein
VWASHDHICRGGIKIFKALDRLASNSKFLLAKSEENLPLGEWLSASLAYGSLVDPTNNYKKSSSESKHGPQALISGSGGRVDIMATRIK